ncbi:MAG TPA: hypothetical protein VL156_07020 [Terriglobales bacterium]|nr:hypothetical protein [Terriglobales bacterium]
MSTRKNSEDCDGNHNSRAHYVPGNPRIVGELLFHHAPKYGTARLLGEGNPDGDSRPATYQ